MYPTQEYPNVLTELKGEIENDTIIVGDFIPHLDQWIDHPDRK